jgi:uncharacterized protein YqgV (UPF0045/DUF77 family)
MHLSCQFAVYPLGVDKIGPAIDATVMALNTRGLEVQTGPMSTTVTGPTDVIFAGFAQIFTDTEAPTVLVTTIANACPAHSPR